MIIVFFVLCYCIEPPIMSNSSEVIACWRALLYASVSCSISSSALSVATCIAITRAECSAARLSSRAVKILKCSEVGINDSTMLCTDGSMMKSSCFPLRSAALLSVPISCRLIGRNVSARISWREVDAKCW